MRSLQTFFKFLLLVFSLPALGPGSLGDLCSIAWWKGLKADAPTVGCGCVCGWWPGGGGRQCGGKDPRGNPPHPWPAPCSRPRCCNPVQSKKCRLHVSEDSVYSASPLSSCRGDLHIARMFAMQDVHPLYVIVFIFVYVYIYLKIFCYIVYIKT